MCYKYLCCAIFPVVFDDDDDDDGDDDNSNGIITKTGEIMFGCSNEEEWYGWGHMAQMGEKINAYRVLVVVYEIERSLGRHRHVWEDNIKMNLKGIG